MASHIVRRGSESCECATLARFASTWATSSRYETETPYPSRLTLFSFLWFSRFSHRTTPGLLDHAVWLVDFSPTSWSYLNPQVPALPWMNALYCSLIRKNNLETYPVLMIKSMWALGAHSRWNHLWHYMVTKQLQFEQNYTREESSRTVQSSTLKKTADHQRQHCCQPNP